MSKQTLILLYGGRSAERDVSVLSAESVMRAINYDKFLVKTYFISQAGDFVKTQEFASQPGADEKLMTNATLVASQQIKPAIFTRKMRLSSLSCTGQWAKMAPSKVF